MNKAIFGLANSQEQTDRVISKLQAAGFNTEDISVLMPDKNQPVQGNEYTKGKKGTLGIEKNTKAAEGGATGATAGGIIGGSIGLLAGVGSLAIPGLGVLIVGGPIVAALSGSAVGGALGLFIGSLVGMGIPEYEAKKYETQVKNGRILISVHTEDSDQLDRVKQIFQKNDISDISTSREIAGTR